MKKVLQRYAIKPVQQFAYSTGKNATDSTLIIDAMDLLYTRKFDGFRLITSDSDFTGLAMRLREEGLMVLGFGEKKTPEAFKMPATSSCSPKCFAWYDPSWLIRRQKSSGMESRSQRRRLPKHHRPKSNFPENLSSPRLSSRLTTRAGPIWALSGATSTSCSPTLTPGSMAIKSSPILSRQKRTSS